MAQGGFDFTVPPADVTTTSPTGQSLASLPPIAPAQGVSRHCSAMGALKASEHAEAQMQRVLVAYREHGPLTDAEVEKLTGIGRSSVIPRRTELVRRGLVEKDGRTRKNPATGVSNTLWRLRR
jgi:hypothetical protein